jgi:hypothetical protein
MAFRESVAELGRVTPYDEQLLAEAGGDWNRYALFKGVIAQESAWVPNAMNPNDPSYGLMQLMLPTARIFVPDATPELLLNQPSVNIAAGTAFLRDLLRRFNDQDAIAYYNAGCPTPKVAGLSGCPLRNASGQYVNSQGLTTVQAHVDSVISYQVWYLNHLPALSLPSEPVAAGDEWSLTMDDMSTSLESLGVSLAEVDVATVGVAAALLVAGAAVILSGRS